MHVPFAMNDRAVLHAMAVAAGFADTEILRLPGDSEAPSARDAARGFVRGRIDDNKREYPEFVDSNGRTTNTSGGGIFQGGLTFYW